MPTGVYISVPFCRSKCSYCNFASGVFSRGLTAKYVDRVCADIASAEEIARRAGGVLDRTVDSVYLGGGTPTILAPAELCRIFHTLRREFDILPGAEITVEGAPGTLTPEILDALLSCGVNRVSLGVQSFVDAEAAAVARLHNRATIFEDIARLRSAGVTNLNLDLIAGLPHQTPGSWGFSLEQAIASGAPHLSVYMLEVDEDSRLGRELVAGGSRYHAHHVPDEDLIAELYVEAGAALDAAGIAQYEISNFARAGMESRHNLKYWTRQPYIGFGLDAHSMLPSSGDGLEAVRFSTADELDQFLAGAPVSATPVPESAALEEKLFLGLRLTRGIDWAGVGGSAALAGAFTELEELGLLERSDSVLRLTPKGRLLSNEVFQRFIFLGPVPAVQS